MRIQKEIENVERVKDKIATMPLTMEDAIEFHKQVVDRIEKERKEINKELDLDSDIEEKGFTGASKEPKKVSTPELKKMKLSESLFESLNEGYFITDFNKLKRILKKIADDPNSIVIDPDYTTIDVINGKNCYCIYANGIEDQIIDSIAQHLEDDFYTDVEVFDIETNSNNVDFNKLPKAAKDDLEEYGEEELNNSYYKCIALKDSVNESLNESDDDKKEKIDQIKNEIMSDDHDKLLDKMLWTIVPDSGKSDTLAGELVRAAARLVQRSDDVFYDSLGGTVLNSAAFLINNMPKKSGVPKMLISMVMMSDYLRRKNKGKYPEDIVNMADRVAEYIYNEDPSLLVRPNKLDMLNDSKKYRETASKIINKEFYNESLNECDKFKKGDCKNYALDEAVTMRAGDINDDSIVQAREEEREKEKARRAEEERKAKEEAKRKERIGDDAWSEKDWIAEREKGDLDLSKYSDEEKAEIEKRLRNFDNDPTAQARYKRKKEQEARNKEEEERKKAEQEKEEKTKKNLERIGKVANAPKDIGNAFKKGLGNAGIHIG